jgi:hypothetical protein
VITIAIWTSFFAVARFMALKSLTPLDFVLCCIVGAALLLSWEFFMVRKMRTANPKDMSPWISPCRLS